MSAGGFDLDDWVLTEPVPDVAMRTSAMRGGNLADSLAPRPAAALRILHTFACRRGIGDLLDSARHFEHLDAMAILATAAFSRPVEEAAELAIGQWGRESAAGIATTPLTKGIVYDVASQRNALDVAMFIRKCREVPSSGLVGQTTRVFVATRTNLDKARLYLLLRDGGFREEAADLLKLTLREAGRRVYTTVADGPDELHDLVGALHHLSPSQRILEEWIEEAMKDPLDLAVTVNLVANLLTGAPRGAESLAEYVGKNWDHHDLTQVCALLSDVAPEAGDGVLRWLAARQDVKFLAEIIITWHRSAVLTKSTEHLIEALVAGDENRGPRPRADIDRILANLEAYNAPAECVRMLRTAAATQVAGRTGSEVAELLGCIENRREHRRAARLIGEGLAEKVLRDRTAADEELFVEYLKALRQREDADSAYWALRELADPAEGELARAGAAAVIGTIARRLYAEGLDADGFNLLERCLENEQWVTPEDVGDVVASLKDKDGRMSAESLLDLLSATVGRWAELRRRGQAVAELQRRGFDDEAEAVIRSVH